MRRTVSVVWQRLCVFFHPYLVLQRPQWYVSAVAGITRYSACLTAEVIQLWIKCLSSSTKLKMTKVLPFFKGDSLLL